VCVTTQILDLSRQVTCLNQEVKNTQAMVEPLPAMLSCERKYRELRHELKELAVLEAQEVAISLHSRGYDDQATT
jgi:hypothetical protein